MVEVSRMGCCLENRGNFLPSSAKSDPTTVVIEVVGCRVFQNPYLLVEV